jgi:eukaryotic-like serine/threonine-protein kinase
MTFIAETGSPTTDIGKYRVVAELARGGMGNVYLAVVHGPGGFNKLVAVKELKPEFCEDETYVTMFLEEARVAARLTHPNIVQTYEVGSDGLRHFIIMEYLDGRTLYRIGRQLSRFDSSYGSFPLGAQLRIISEALTGLHHAHELCDFDGQSLGIVHRDVSPLNVIVTFDGQTKVVDFGIAKAADSALETRTGILKGRIAYMAPEQACGGTVDRRADVYSAGVMIWEAAAGRRLWPNMSDVEVLTQMLREGPPSLRAICPSAPPELDAICARAMAREPGERYPTAAALVYDLEEHLSRRDDSMRMREVGALVGRAFESERRKMSAIIEESIVRVRHNPQSGRQATLNRTSGTQTVSLVRGQREDRGSLPSLLAQTPSSLASIRMLEPVGTHAVTDPRHVAVALPNARTPLGWIAAMTATCVVSTALAVAPTHHDNPSPSIPVLAPHAAQIVTPAAAAAPAASAPHVEPELVDVSIRVVPPAALIAIDGVVVRGNPVHVRTGRDGRTHRIVAQADGYEPKIEDVYFAGDVTVDIALDRRLLPLRPALAHGPAVAPGAAARSSKAASDVAHVTTPAASETAAAPAPSPATPATPIKDLDPAGGRLPLRPIVTTNPYGTP